MLLKTRLGLLKTRFDLLKLRFKNFLFAPLCVIRNCSNAAKHTAHIQIMGGDGFSMGRFLPVCKNEKCFEKIKKVEGSDHITRGSLDTLITMVRQSSHQRLGVLRSFLP